MHRFFIRTQPLSTTAKVDVRTVYHCARDNLCMLRADLIDGNCPRCGAVPRDITDSPIGKAWLMIVNPKPNEERKY